MTALEGKALLDHGKAIAQRYARRVGPDTAEDLRAEAVLRALRAPAPDGRIEPWLERIYRNLFVDLWRRGELPTVDIADCPELASAGTPEELVLRRERRRLVRESLAQLPRDARQALVSRYYAELSDSDAASRLGVAAATVRTRIHRSLARLRDRLSGLRALFPTLIGRMGAHATALVAAPVLVAAFALEMTPAPQTPLTPETPALREAVQFVRVTALPAQMITETAAPPDKSAPTLRSRLRVPRMVSTGRVELEEEALEVISMPDQSVTLDIEQPDTIEVAAGPARSEHPILVEVPTSFTAQFDKMVEESL